MKKLLLLIAFVLAIVPFTSNAQWQEINTGLYGGRVNCFAQIGDTVFAGTNGGVFYSVNNGQNWTGTNSGLGNLNVNAMTVYNFNSINYLLAATNSGLYVSGNRGANWNHITDSGHLIDNVHGTSLGVLTGSTGPYLFMGSADGYAFVSNDNYTYTRVLLNTDDTVRCFISTGDKFFAGTEGGIYKSTNFGASWAWLASDIGTHSVRNFTQFNNSIYAATDAGIYNETNQGDQWLVTPMAGLPQLNTSSIISIESILFCGTMGCCGEASGIFTSDDNANSWLAANNGITDLWITTLFKSGSTLYAGTIGRGVFISTNYGVTWVKSNTGLSALKINKIKYFNGELYAASASEGLFISDNMGDNWANISSGLASIDWSAFNVNDLAWVAPFVYIATNGAGVLSTYNNGVSWTQVPDFSSDYVSCITTDAIGDIYAGMTGGSGLYETTDNGNTWHSIMTGFPSFNYYSLFSLGSYVYAGADGQIYYSTNNGSTWTQTNYGLSYENTVLDIYTAVPEKILVATKGAGIIYNQDLSLDTWSAVSGGIPNMATTSLSGSPKYLILFAGTQGSGLYMTTNDGIHWLQEDLGLPVENISNVQVIGDSIYVGTDGKGAFRAKISDLITGVADHTSGSNECITAFPNPASKTIDVILKGRGTNETISLIDLSGGIRTLFEGFLDDGPATLKLDISGIAPGTYFLRQDSNLNMFKLIIE